MDIKQKKMTVGFGLPSEPRFICFSEKSFITVYLGTEFKPADRNVTLCFP